VIRQARIYLAGAVSGTALIAAAVVAFVVLVSLQSLRDWPLAGLGGGGKEAAESGSVAPGQPAAEGGAPVAGTPAAGTGSSVETIGNRGQSGDRTAGNAPGSSGSVRPAAGAPGSNPAAERGDSAQRGNGNGSASRGNGSANPPGGGNGGGDSSSSASETATGAVNDTVSGVDSATGGMLGEAGVTKVTEDVVNGLAGPESTVGKTVDRSAEAVNGLLGDGR
jgi:hypothetical protein